MQATLLTGRGGAEYSDEGELGRGLWGGVSEAGSLEWSRFEIRMKWVVDVINVYDADGNQWLFLLLLRGLVFRASLMLIFAVL